MLQHWELNASKSTPSYNSLLCQLFSCICSIAKEFIGITLQIHKRCKPFLQRMKWTPCAAARALVGHSGGCTTSRKEMAKWLEHTICFLSLSSQNTIYSKCIRNSFNNKGSGLMKVNNCMPVSFPHCLLSVGTKISPFLLFLYSSLFYLDYKSPGSKSRTEWSLEKSGMYIPA